MHPAVSVTNHVFRFDERAIPQLDMTAALRIARYNEYLSTHIRRRPVFSTSGAPDRCHQTAIRRSDSSGLPSGASFNPDTDKLLRLWELLCACEDTFGGVFENVEAVLAGKDSRFDFPLLAHFAVDHQSPVSPPKTTTKKESV